MCRRVTCPTCKKATWAGCGQHVEDVLGNVPADQRCDCHLEGGGGGGAGGFLRKILGG